MAKTRRKRIVRGVLRVGGRSYPTWADLDAPAVKTEHRYSDAEISHMLGERARDRKGRFAKRGVLAKLKSGR